jgi:hypothetical protein
MINQQKKNRLLILIIFAMTFIPFMIAWGLKEHPELLSGKTNHGQLITPPITTERRDFSGFDTFSADNIKELAGHWLIVNVIPNNQCNEQCLEALLKTRQLRLMLNKDLPRTRRIVMVYNQIDQELANQLWLKDALLWRLRQGESKGDKMLYSSLLREENKIDDRLVSKLLGQENNAHVLNSDLIRVVPNDSVKNKIAGLRQGRIADGMLFLMDPLGNFMMQYEPGFDPYQVKSDLMHLLRSSQIG